jgi:hypothetical protein
LNCEFREDIRNFDEAAQALFGSVSFSFGPTSRTGRPATSTY